MIESFIDATSGLPSPEIFRKWTAISTVAAALERRVWMASAMTVLYPNLFVLLVAPPGVGKSVAIREGISLAERTRKLKLAPEDVTKAALLDALAESHQVKLYSPTDMVEYHSMFIGADELGVLLPAHDLAFLNTLNVLYDNRPEYKETRRSREAELKMVNPQVNLLAGTQPDYLGSLLPPEAWGMGFMTRIMMVYSGTPSKVKLFGKRITVNTSELLSDLNTIAELHGEFMWEEKAKARIELWHDNGMVPVPSHSKLKNYLPRRIIHVLKLAMVSSASRSSDLIISEIDVERAIDWLIEIELLMPDIFKDMNGKSDVQIMQDLHYYVWELWSKEKKQIHRARIDMFLGARTPAYNVENVVKLCISSGILIDRGLGMFEPGAVNGTGRE